MFVESFHRLLKTVYYNKSKIAELTTLYTPCCILQIKHTNACKKKHKGKYSHRISEINKRHKLAETMLAAGATPEFNTNHWKVTSERDASQFYWVTKVLENCKNCELICASCNICVHMYLCTCLDFSLHTTVCKHIHVVGLKTNSKVCEREDVVASNLKYFEDILARDGCATYKDVAPL